MVGFRRISADKPGSALNLPLPRACWLGLSRLHPEPRHQTPRARSPVRHGPASSFQQFQNFTVMSPPSSPTRLDKGCPTQNTSQTSKRPRHRYSPLRIDAGGATSFICRFAGGSTLPAPFQMMKRLLVDMDGVLADACAHFAAYDERDTGRRKPPGNSPANLNSPPFPVPASMPPAPPAFSATVSLRSLIASRFWNN